MCRRRPSGRVHIVLHWRRGTAKGTHLARQNVPELCETQHFGQVPAQPLLARRCIVLSCKVIQILECRNDSIANLFVEKIRKSPELKHFQELPDGTLQDWGYRILNDLRKWLLAAEDEALVTHYESPGLLRFGEC